MTKEQQREERYPGQGKAGLFLVDRNAQAANPERLHGQLLDISCNGVSLALEAVITDRKHLAYAPMESDQFKLHIVFYLEDNELIIPVHTTWFDKKLNEEKLPFRIGMEFVTPITSDQLKKIRAA